MQEGTHSDSHQLAEFGYRQELHRTLGSFSSFAAGYSYISILTGMFQTAGLGFFFAGFLAFCGYKWFTDDSYGINHANSLKYMAVLYLIAIAIYVISRVVRRREGIDLAMINSEIPVE